VLTSVGRSKILIAIDDVFFKYSKYYSVTSMLLELGLPSFDTLIINSRVNLTRQLHCSNNSVIRQQTLGLHVI